MTALHEMSPPRPVPAASATLSNGLYGVAEYVSQPLGMLLAAPYLLRHLGASQFGVWVLASAAVNGGNLLSTGFGDAAVKYGAMYRGRNDLHGAERVTRGIMAINLSLSGLLALVLWTIAPLAVKYIPHIDVGLRAMCTQSFRIGSILLVVRSIDGVFVSILRAFEHYSPAVRITICSRISILLAAVVLVARGDGVDGIMLATLCISIVSLVAQGLAVRAYAGSIVLLPSWHREPIAMIAGFGSFSWLQAISSVAFSQLDRLLIGLFLGTPAVATYAVCAQAAQTIHGISGAGLHVLFPHLSARIEGEPLANVRRSIWTAFRINLALAAFFGIPMIVFSHLVLRLWMGADFAQNGWLPLSILSAAFTLFALNVTAHYTLLATGRVAVVTAFNLSAGIAMLVLMALLIPHFGILGAACARLVTGPITCMLYVPLWKMLRSSTATASPVAAWENS